MRHLGALQGSGMVESGGHAIGRADYDLDGYLVKPGQVVASGEVRMVAGALHNAFGRNDLVLRTDDGQLLPIRFSGRGPAAAADIAHVDVREGLPPPTAWKRREV